MLPELLVVMDELDTVFGEFTVLFLRRDEALRIRVLIPRLSIGDSAIVKNLSVGLLAPSRKDDGLSDTSI